MLWQKGCCCWPVSSVEDSSLKSVLLHVSLCCRNRANAGATPFRKHRHSGGDQAVRAVQTWRSACYGHARQRFGESMRQFVKDLMSQYDCDRSGDCQRSGESWWHFDKNLVSRGDSFWKIWLDFGTVYQRSGETLGQFVRDLVRHWDNLSEIWWDTGTVCQRFGETLGCLSKIWRVMGLFVKDLGSHLDVCQRVGESITMWLWKIRWVSGTATDLISQT